MSSSGKQSRKWQLTFNRPEEHGITRDDICRKIGELKSVVYFCMSDEIGLENGTPHTHLFLAAKSGIRFDTLKMRFPSAHIEPCHGSCAENRDYIAKTGKWENNPKSDSSVPGSFVEVGELPSEPGAGFRSDLASLTSMISEGYSDAEILRTNPNLAAHIHKMEKIRQTLIEEEYSKKLRLDLQVIYVQGPSGVGKSRDIIERHGIERVYRVLDFEASGKWDFYKPKEHDVVVLEEFRSNLTIGLLLNLTDIYPIRLSARYSDKIGTYSFLYIVSNWPLEKQYENVQRESPDSWKALLRRISKVHSYDETGKTTEYTVDEYYKSLNVPSGYPAWVEEAEKAQEELPF